MRAKLVLCLGLVPGLMRERLCLAQTCPPKSVRLIDAWPAGGTVDSLTRVIAPKLAEDQGQPAVVENRPESSQALQRSPVRVTLPSAANLMRCASSDRLATGCRRAGTSS